MNTHEHLMFMNTPINGSLTMFIEKMKAVGFELCGRGEDLAKMSGSFIGRNCSIAINVSPESDSVYGVTVFFESGHEAWSAIKADYQRIVSIYRQKYGEPTTKIEKFEYPYKEGDGLEMEALNRLKCQYMSQWHKAEGMIAVLMVDNRIGIMYQGKKNIALDNEDYSNQI